MDLSDGKGCNRESKASAIRSSPAVALHSREPSARRPRSGCREHGCDEPESWYHGAVNARARSGGWCQNKQRLHRRSVEQGRWPQPGECYRSRQTADPSCGAGSIHDLLSPPTCAFCQVEKATGSGSLSYKRRSRTGCRSRLDTLKRATLGCYHRVSGAANEPGPDHGRCAPACSPEQWRRYGRATQNRDRGAHP